MSGNDVPPRPPEPPTSRRAAGPPGAARRSKLLVGTAVGLGGLLVGAAVTLAVSRGSGEAAPAPTVTVTRIQTVTESPTPANQGTFDLTGTFQLADGAVAAGTDDCKGAGGYTDIFEGTAVTVYDAAGTVVATGSLGDSTLADGTCTFEVAVPGVPRGDAFYKVEVAHRGTVQLTEEQAEYELFGASLG